MNGVKEIPHVLVPREGEALPAVVEKGERYPQQRSRGIDAQCVEPSVGEQLFREEIQDEPVPGQGHEEQPQQGLFADGPVFRLVKDQNEQDVAAAALGEAEVMGKHDHSGG